MKRDVSFDLERQNETVDAWAIIYNESVYIYIIREIV